MEENIIPTIAPLIEPHAALAHIASEFIGVKEEGVNKGKWVETFQKAVDGKAQGEPWCAAFVMYCVGQVESQLSVKSEIFKAELVMSVWNKTPSHLKSQEPKPGFIVCWSFGKTGTGHMGIVESHDDKALTFNTIEGNTSDGSGIVREGDGVYRRTRKLGTTGQFNLLGFIDPFAAPSQSV